MEAVKAYHSDLQQLGIRPYRSLSDDLQQTSLVASYSGSSKSPDRVGHEALGRDSATDPDFSKMSQAEKLQWNLERWRRILD